MQGLLAGHDAQRFHGTLIRLEDALKAQPMPDAWTELVGVDPAHRRIIDLLISLAAVEGQDLVHFLAEAISMAADSEPLLRLVRG